MVRESSQCSLSSLEWGNSFLAKRVARGLVKIGIVAPVTF